MRRLSNRRLRSAWPAVLSDAIGMSKTSRSSWRGLSCSAILSISVLFVANVIAADGAPDAAVDNVKNEEIAQFGKLVVVGDRLPFFKRFGLMLFGTRYLFAGRPRDGLRVCGALLDMSESSAETDFAETCIAGAQSELGDFEGAERIFVAKMAKLAAADKAETLEYVGAGRKLAGLYRRQGYLVLAERMYVRLITTVETKLLPGLTNQQLNVQYREGRLAAVDKEISELNSQIAEITRSRLEVAAVDEPTDEQRAARSQRSERLGLIKYLPSDH